jgi:hypothetical protein
VLRQPWALAAAVLVLAVYVAALSVMPKGAFWSPDEGAKFIEMHSIEWRHGLRYAVAYGGHDLDSEFAFYPTQCRFEDLYPVPLAGGAVKFHWPIWFPLGSRFLVSALGLTGLYVTPLLSGWLVALLAGYLMRAWEPRLAPVAILAVGLATPIAFFSLTFWEHTLATGLGIAALAIVAGGHRFRPPVRWLTVPLLLAAAALRIEMALYGVAVGCAWLIAGRLARGDVPAPRFAAGRRRVAVLLFGSAGAIVLLLVFSGTLPERHRWILTVLPTYLSGSIARLPYVAEILTAILIDNRGNQAPIVPHLWRYLMLAACFAVAGASLLRSRRWEALLLLAALVALLEFSLYLIVRPEAYVSLHGFLPIAPFLVFAVYIRGPAWRERRRDQLAVVITAAAYGALVYAAIFVFLVGPDGIVPSGLEWGNRYLLSLYPLGTVLALAALDEYRRSARPVLLKHTVVVLAAGLLLCGVLLQARGVWTLIESRRLVSTWQAALHDGPPVVTDVWWLPAAMAPLFITHPVHCVRHDADLATWYPIALRHGAETFTFASFRPVDVSRLPHDGFEVEAAAPEVVAGLHLTRVRIAPAGASVAAPAPPVETGP